MNLIKSPEQRQTKKTGLKFYDILEISTTATTDEIRTAYKKLAKKYHPDNGGEPETFKLLQLAYETLIDPEKRKSYDEMGDTLGDSIYDEAMTCIRDGFMIAVNTAEKVDPGSQSILEIMKLSMEESLDQIPDKKTEIRMAIARLEKINGRITKKNTGKNLFEIALSKRIAELSGSLVKLDRKDLIYRQALKMLRDYDEDVPLPKSCIFGDIDDEIREVANHVFQNSHGLRF